MFLGCCFLSEITRSGHRLGTAPTTQLPRVGYQVPFPVGAECHCGGRTSASSAGISLLKVTFFFRRYQVSHAKTMVS